MIMSSDEVRIQVDGLALKQELSESDNWLPDVDGSTHYPPYKHQVEMRNIIENKDRFVAMNTTITGGGKTFSYAVPVMRRDMSGIVIFPTNALTADQSRSIGELATEYFPEKDIFIRELTADKMQNRREIEKEKGNLSSSSMKNSEQVKRALDSADKNNGPSFLLTNPDVFMGIMRGNYGQVARQKLELLDIMVVDEFHHARPKGQNSLIMTMDELYHRSDDRCNLKRFVFLSATPDEEIEEQLSKYFGNKDNLYHRIDSTEYSKSLSELNVKGNEPFNPVMPQVNTTFISARPFSTKHKISSDEYLDRVVNFVSSGRSIVILDGVAEVNDVCNTLRQEISNRRIEPISGLRSDNMEDKLNNADIIVANSTVEVGVDIGNIEQLVYTGFNAARFMQRLGRLRAGDSIRKSAVCFTTPDAIQTFDSLTEMEKLPIPRSRLQDIVNHQLGADTDMNLFKSEFSPVEMYRAIDERAKSMYNSKSDYRKNASKIVAKHCFKATGASPRKEDIERMWKMADSPLGEAMQSYRQSSLTALVYDDRPECQSVKTYPITSLLRLANIEFMTELEFDDKLEDRDVNPELYSTEKKYVQTYAWMNSYSSGDTLRNPHVVPNNQIQSVLGKNPSSRDPLIVNSIEFTVEDNAELSGLNILNRQLSKNLGGKDGTKIIGYITEGHPAQIQTIYGLDEFFFTNPIANLNGQYSLALGENALYLYCHIQENLGAAQKLYEDYLSGGHR
jgi:CRISPR-associated helicase Cas3